MNAQALKDMLRRQPFAQGLREDEIESLGRLARLVRHESGHLIFREGQESADFYLIVSGRVALEIVPPTGAFCLDTLGPGEEFGWSSVLGQKTVFQASVLQDLEALAFDVAELRALCEKDPAFGYRFMRRLLGVVSDRLQVTRLHLMDSYWPVARRAGA